MLFQCKFEEIMYFTICNAFSLIIGVFNQMSIYLIDDLSKMLELCPKNREIS